jgi:UDP-glucose 4-epimerase
MKTLIIGGRGYIGSRLAQHIEADIMDADWFCARHGDAIDFGHTTGRFAPYDVIVLLAGHSSIAMCEVDPYGAWHNNVTRFVDLCQELQPGQKLIFASSSALEDTGTYGLTKRTIELFAAAHEVEYYALRFGTVAGWSPNLRTDLVVNAMVSDAVNKGEIVVSNRGAVRPILGIRDLCRSVKVLIDDRRDLRGSYNLASFNATMGEIADRVATRCNVPIRKQRHGGTRSFEVGTSAFRGTFTFEFIDTLDAIIDDLLGHRNALNGTARAKPPDDWIP